MLKLSVGVCSVAIYLTNSQINKVYFASSDVKAVCLQNDSNKIYPNIAEVIEHSLLGAGTGTHLLTVPAGYDRCKVICDFPAGMGNYSVSVYNNGKEVFESATMSGTIVSDIFTVSEGSLEITVTDMLMDGYTLKVTLYPAQEVTPEEPEPLQPIRIDIQSSGAFSTSRDIPAGYSTLSYGITVDGSVESFIITYGSDVIVEEYGFGGYISNSVPLNGVGGHLSIAINTLDSSVMVDGAVEILL